MLRHRRATGNSLIEGPHVIADALEAGARVSTLFMASDDAKGLEIADEYSLAPIPVDEPALRRLAGTDTPRGPIAVVKMAPAAPAAQMSQPPGCIVPAWSCPAATLP